MYSYKSVWNLESFLVGLERGRVFGIYILQVYDFVLLYDSYLLVSWYPYFADRRLQIKFRISKNFLVYRELPISHSFNSFGLWSKSMVGTNRDEGVDDK